MKNPTPYLLIAMLLISSCSLKRSNPLDPFENSEIEVPNTVTGLVPVNTSAPGAPDKFVTLQWNWIPPTAYHPSGFRIYRSLAYMAQFELVDTLATFYDSEDLQITEDYTHTGTMPGDYWYKVSAYIYYGHDQPLEGRACDPVFVRIRP